MPSGVTRNALVNTAGSLAAYGSVFLVTPMAIASLGVSGWGVWQLLSATTALLLLLTLGLESAVNHEVAGAIADRDEDRLASAVGTARIYFFATAVLLVVLALLIARPLVESLVPPPDAARARLALLVVVGASAGSLCLQFYGSVIAGAHRSDLLGLFRAVQAVVFLLAAWIGFRLEMGLVGFALLMGGAPAE